MRVVVDTSVLVSAMLNAQSVPGRALVLAASPPHVMLYSSATVAELLDVVERPKFDRFLRVERRRSFVATYLAEAEPVVVEAAVRACRDPNDDMVLALALDGRADVIVTGDRDLLTLHPWRGVDILAPGDFIDR